MAQVSPILRNMIVEQIGYLNADFESCTNAQLPQYMFSVQSAKIRLKQMARLLPSTPASPARPS